ncbi:APC11-like protein with RING finger domain [Equine molluscum contagiosum-like virus]|nr:APC11-like protein with RING finger domain [Equine molluscum contagiosum-like virus]
MSAVKLLYWNPTVQWNLKNCDNVCYICRNPLGRGCLRAHCESECEVLLLRCGHGYHEHCMPRGARVCFVCRQPLILHPFNIRK